MLSIHRKFRFKGLKSFFHVFPKLELFGNVLLDDRGSFVQHGVVQVVENIVIASLVEMGIFEVQYWDRIKVGWMQLTR